MGAIEAAPWLVGIAGLCAGEVRRVEDVGDLVVEVNVRA